MLNATHSTHSNHPVLHTLTDNKIHMCKVCFSRTEYIETLHCIQASTHTKTVKLQHYGEINQTLMNVAFSLKQYHEEQRFLINKNCNFNNLTTLSCELNQHQLFHFMF